MTSTFTDKFDRVDGSIGANYTVPCGGVLILDETVLPVDITVGSSGVSPLTTLMGRTDQKTQVLYTGETMDGPDYVSAAIWSHDEELIGDISLSTLLTTAINDPSFTVLARMSKDPMLVALGVEDPHCYNQGYGARITCPRSGAAPILKIVKYTPRHLPAGYIPPTSAEIDLAMVLATKTLVFTDMNIDPAWDGTGNFPYRGFQQEVRLRIRRADYSVVLEVFMNDRSMNTPILSYTDQRDPLWGAAGVPGFEFISPARATQKAGHSPFELLATPVMRCALYETQTIKDFRRASRVSPANFYTYDRVVDRTIQLVERDGDARYTATGAGATKRQVYLQFVIEAEADIIRKEGYYHWLRREARLYLVTDLETYELPEDLGMVEQVRPGNFTGQPLVEMTPNEFRTRLAGTTSSSAGKPRIYTPGEESVNNRKTIIVYPKANIGDAQPTLDNDLPFLVVDYFARQLYPDQPDVQIPFVPQAHMDVLSYGAAAHALMMDTDEQNSARFMAIYQQKLMDLRHDNNRKHSDRRTIIRSAADYLSTGVRVRVPMLRAAQLETFLWAG